MEIFGEYGMANEAKMAKPGRLDGCNN